MEEQDDLMKYSRTRNNIKGASYDHIIYISISVLMAPLMIGEGDYYSFTQIVCVAGPENPTGSDTRAGKFKKMPKPSTTFLFTCGESVFSSVKVFT